MAAIQVGDTVAHWAAEHAVMGEVDALGAASDGNPTADITWTERGEQRRMTVPLEQLVPLCTRDGSCCGLIPGDL
jgi:hypothetical protein